MINKFLISIAILTVISCTQVNLPSKDESNLSVLDIGFIRSVIDFDSNENIEFYNSIGGVEQSGSFITNSRLVHYYRESTDTVQAIWADFKKINNMRLIDNSKVRTNASYILASIDPAELKFFFDVDSTRLIKIYESAKSSWMDSRK